MTRVTAHEWSSRAVARFIETELSLPVAAKALAAARVDSRSLLCLTEELLQRYGVDGVLQRRKILAHAQELRDEAFTALNASRGDDPEQWSAWETAAWAAVEKGCGKAAVFLLRRNYSFKALCGMEKAGLRQALKPLPGEERHQIMLHVLQHKLQQVKEQDAKQQPTPNPEGSSKKQTKKRKPTSTATQSSPKAAASSLSRNEMTELPRQPIDDEIAEKHNQHEDNDDFAAEGVSLEDADEVKQSDEEELELEFELEFAIEDTHSEQNAPSASDIGEEEVDTNDNDEKAIDGSVNAATSDEIVLDDNISANEHIEGSAVQPSTETDEESSALQGDDVASNAPFEVSDELALSTQGEEILPCPISEPNDIGQSNEHRRPTPLPESPTIAASPTKTPTPMLQPPPNNQQHGLAPAAITTVPKLEPLNLQPVPTPLELMAGVVDTTSFTGAVERLRATASEAWADLFEKFKFQKPTLLPAGLTSQTVLFHLADLWLQLGHTLETTFAQLQASPAKQCLMLVRQAAERSHDGVNRYEKAGAFAYALLYFRAKWIRSTTQHEIFETDLSQLTDLKLGQLTRHEFQGEVSAVLQLQTPWEQFDSIFRTIDRDKTGTVQLSELLRAFTYPPLPHSIKGAASINTTELVLLCLTMATDAPLANALPFTSTIQQCMDRAVVNRNTTDLPSTSASREFTQQGAVLTMTTIASMLSDWIAQSLHPWFQAANQRQPHRHRRIPKGLFVMLKLLHDNGLRQQICEILAKQFRIYVAQRTAVHTTGQTLVPDGSSLLAQIPDFAALLYTFVLFRLSSLRKRLQQLEPKSDGPSNEIQASIMRLQAQLQDYIATYPASQAREPKENEGFDQLVMGLLGISIPVGAGDAPLSACLSHIQWQLLVYGRNCANAKIQSVETPTDGNRVDGAALPTPPSTLSGVELRQSYRQSVRTVNASRPFNGDGATDKHHRDLERQMNDLSNAHRSDQLNNYIELLEGRLADRKIFLRSLCAFCESYLDYATDSLDAAMHCVQDVRVYGSMFNIPLNALTEHTGVSAAFETLRKLKVHFSEQLMGPMHSRIQQLEQRVGKLRASMDAGDVTDDTGVLWGPINKASTIEAEIMNVNKLTFQLFDDAEEQTQQGVLRVMKTQRRRAVLMRSSTLTQSVGR